MSTLLNGKIVPSLGRKRLADVSGTDGIKFHNALKSTPTLANRAVTALAAMYSWAADQGHKQARTTSRSAHLADHPMRLASDLVWRVRWVNLIEILELPSRSAPNLS